MLSQVAELSPVVLVIVVYRMFYLKIFLKRETKRNGKNSPPPQIIIIILLNVPVYSQLSY